MRVALKQHSVEHIVPFHDTDAMQVVWHGNYLKYFEMARDALFAEAGVQLFRFHETSGFLFPITRTSTKHIHPLRYHDRFVCTARLVECRRKIVLEYEVRLAEGDILCARGTSEQVAIRSRDFLLQLTIPDAIRQALGYL